MATTGHGFNAADSGDQVDTDGDIQQLATTIETGFVAYETFNSWTPTFDTSGANGGITSVGGSGFNQGFYLQRGKFVHAQFRIELASGLSVDNGPWVLPLPVVAFAWAGS